MMTFERTRTSVTVRGSRRSTGEEGGTVREQQSVHVPVMVAEVVEALAPRATDTLFDATYGRGGHAAILKPLVARYVAVDADPAAGEGVITANFGELSHVLERQGIARIDKALFDLGWNRTQLAAGRGFSFAGDEPLAMSYGPEPASGFFARDILNTWSERALADVFYGYGEERYARRIARAVVERRVAQPFETTAQFVETVSNAVPAAYRRGRIHFATRSFQALRIAVNDELGVLEKGLKAAWEHLSCNGRIAVITFHSIEDRIVKRLFASWAKEDGALLYKKPLVPSRQEIIRNPAARTAKLRAIEKICIA